MALGKKTGGRNVKPGQVLNPNGRPKSGQAMTDILRTAIEEVQQLRDLDGNPVKDKDGKIVKMKIKEAVVRKMVQNAVKGNQYAINKIFEYIDGKPLQMMGFIGGGVPIDLPDATITEKEKNHMKKQIEIIFGKKKKGKK